MTPILLYPKNEAQAKFFQNAARDNGAEVISFSEKELEWLDDFLFAQKLVERSKNFKEANEEEYEKLIARKLAE